MWSICLHFMETFPENPLIMSDLGDEQQQNRAEEKNINTAGSKVASVERSALDLPEQQGHLWTACTLTYWGLFHLRL